MSESDFQADRPPPPPKVPEVEPIQDRPRPRPVPPRRERPGYEERISSDEPFQDSGVEVLIPYHNPLGLTAYYLGVFSLIPCFALLLGPAALITGIMGVRARQANPRIGGTGHAISGIVLGSITSLINYGILVILLVAYLLSDKH
jgi:hypothetical protein